MEILDEITPKVSYLSDKDIRYAYREFRGRLRLMYDITEADVDTAVLMEILESCEEIDDA